MTSGASVPQDDRLPQLAIALNTQEMKTQLQAALFSSPVPEERYHIQHCDILQARYKRERYCMVSYRLTIEDRQSGQIQEQIVAARFFPTDESISRFTKAKDLALAIPKFGKPIIHVPTLEMVAWAFPNDRKIRFLPDLVNDHFLKENVVPRLVSEHCGSGWNMRDLNHQIVHYVAEHTCTTKVDVELTNEKTRETKSMTVYGKTYYNEEGVAACQHMSQLWNCPARQCGQFEMAKPLWYDEAHRTLWQLGLAGQTVNQYSFKSSELQHLMKQVAESVAALHKTALPCARKLGLEDLLSVINNTQEVLKGIEPESQELLANIVTRLKAESPNLDTKTTATLHGDLHLKNCFFTSGSVALIDLDNLCAGYPLQDIGSFLASLYNRGMLEDIPCHVMEPIVDSFVETYAQRVPWAVLESDLAWFTAAALLTERAVRSITRLKEGKLDRIQDVLMLADRIIGGKVLGIPPKEKGKFNRTTLV